MAFRLTTTLNGAAPVIAGLPVISGIAVEDMTLTATASSTTGTPSPTRTWQWKRSGSNIAGATSATYTLVSADVGETITVVQTETNKFGSDTAESLATGTVAAASGSGTASIVIDDEPTVPVAPAAHQFSITLGSGFTTAPAVAPAIYNPPDHELYYFWDFGEGYTYTAPTQVSTQFKNSRYGYGSRISHVFRTGGTHTVTCLVVEPATGVTATATVDVTVDAPADVFTDSTTMILDSTGAGLAAYPGASVYTTWSALLSALDGATSTANEATTPRQIIIRRGQSFSVGGGNISRSGPWPTTLWRAADEAGAKPILNMTGQLNWFDDFSLMSPGTKGIAFQNIDFRGGWDSTTETYASVTPFVAFGCVAANAPKHFTFDGCRFAGFASMFVEAGSGGYPTALYVNDTEITDWQFYGIIPDKIGSLCITGSNIALPSLANAGGAKSPTPPWFNTHGPVRIGAAATLLVHSTYMYSRADWSGVVNGVRSQQPCIRYDTDGVGGGYHNCQCSVLEGGTVIVGNGVDSAGLVNKTCNIVYEKNYLLATHLTKKLFASDKGGTTVRNNILLVPDTPRYTGYPLELVFTADAAFGTGPDAENRDSPWRAYSNTIINLSTTALGADNINSFTDVVIANNLIYQPNATPALTSEGPLDDTQAFTPRETGYKHNASYGDGLDVLQTAYATPAADVWLGTPEAGAGAIAGADMLDPVAYDDFWGVPRRSLRPTGNFSLGAIEVAA